MNSSDQSVTLRDGRALSIRRMLPEHAERYRAYMIELAEESPWTGTLAHEVKDVDKLQERFEKDLDNECSWGVGAFDEVGNVIADCCWNSIPYDKFRHVATLGIGILAPWRGVGLGRILMEQSIQAASDNEIVQKIELGVFSDNTIARSLYESLGFEIEGSRKRAIRQPDGEFCDDVVMGLWVGDVPK
jgi:ribosomal protein S18 acetylase RimI-like enzyme